MSRSKKPLSFIETDDPDDMPLVLLNGVEALLWKRQPDPEVVQCIKEFDHSRIDLSKEGIHAVTEKLQEEWLESEQVIPY